MNIGIFYNGLLLPTLFRFVDIYTLHSQNLTTKYLNATFHHSRLMGVSDIYNSVSGIGEHKQLENQNTNSSFHG